MNENYPKSQYKFEHKFFESQFLVVQRYQISKLDEDESEDSDSDSEAQENKDIEKKNK